MAYIVFFQSLLSDISTILYLTPIRDISIKSGFNLYTDLIQSKYIFNPESKLITPVTTITSIWFFYLFIWIPSSPSLILCLSLISTNIIRNYIITSIVSSKWFTVSVQYQSKNSPWTWEAFRFSQIWSSTTKTTFNLNWNFLPKYSYTTTCPKLPKYWKHVDH